MSCRYLHYRGDPGCGEHRCWQHKRQARATAGHGPGGCDWATFNVPLWTPRPATCRKDQSHHVSPHMFVSTFTHDLTPQVSRCDSTTLPDIDVGWPPKDSQTLYFEILTADRLLHTLASYVSVRPHGPSLSAPEHSHRSFTIGAMLFIYDRGCYVGDICVWCNLR